MKQQPSVTIIFPIYNSDQHAITCLSSIARLNYPQKQLEVIIVDNHSTDETVKQIKKRFPRVKLITLTQNVGFAKAINLGAKKAKGKYLFITNDDVMFEKNSLALLVSYMQKNPDVGVTSGTIIATNTQPFRYSTGHRMNHWTGKIFPVYESETVSTPEWVQGCALLIRNALFAKLNGFDEDFQHFFEDFDLCERVRNQGFNASTIPQAMIYHGESITANRNRPDKYYKWYKAKFRFILKHFSPLQILSILCIQMFMIIPYRILILRDGRFVPFIKGLAWNIINFRKTWRLR